MDTLSQCYHIKTTAQQEFTRSNVAAIYLFNEQLCNCGNVSVGDSKSLCPLREVVYNQYHEPGSSIRGWWWPHCVLYQLFKRLTHYDISDLCWRGVFRCALTVRASFQCFTSAHIPSQQKHTRTLSSVRRNPACPPPNAPL